MRRLPKLIVPMLVWTLLVVPVWVRAQETPKIERLEVSLWPEYDKDAVLVIYRLQLASDTALPTSVSMPIPADVGEPHAVAIRGADGGLLVAPYTRQVRGEWATITLEAASTYAQLEFYANLEEAGENRSYTFTWPGGIELGELAFEVQEPLGASEMQIEPQMGEQRIGGDGLTYYAGSLGPQASSASLEIDIRYRKTVPGLTTELLQPSPSLGRPETTQGGTPQLMDILPWLATGLGVVVLGVGVYLYFRLVREPARVASRSRRRRPSSSRREGERTLDVAAVFCHNCGTKADVGDRYCRHCGSQLRQ